MDAFNARKKPVGARLLSNTALQISTLAVVALAGGIYARSIKNSNAARFADDTQTAREADQQESQLASAQVESNTAHKKFNETTTASVSPPIGSPDVLPPPTRPSLAQPAAIAPTTAPTTATGGAPAPVAATSAAAGLRAALQPAQNVRVSFIEAQSSFLQELLSDAQQTSADGPASWGVIANLDQRLTASRSWHAISASGSKPLTLNKPNLFYSGASDQTIGLTIQVVPLSRDEAGTRVQIDANRLLHDSASGAADSYNFRMPDGFTLPKGSSLLLTGVLPHRALSESETQLYRNLSVLKSMATDQFRSGATDVAIVIEAR
jgi:hypothetical protein